VTHENVIVSVVLCQKA